MSDLTIRAGWTNQAATADKVNEKVNETGNQNGKKNYFAGDLQLANDPIAQKRKEAQKKAWNVVQNAWDSDQSIDKMIESRQKHATEMAKWKEESLQEISAIEEEKAALRELYGIKEDSQEQKDLELLEKQQDFENRVSADMPTPEEQKRLAEIKKQPLTEYQERALELNQRAGKYKKDLQEAERQRIDDESDMRSISKERLKTHPMLDAKKQAEEIQKAANAEIVGMLVQEATDHIDEVLEEAEEEGKEAAEKKEEREEHLEEIKEQRAIQEAVIEGTREAAERAEAEQRKNDAPEMAVDDMLEIALESNKKSAQVQESLDEIKYSMKVLEADLKGIKVDKEV